MPRIFVGETSVGCGLELAASHRYGLPMDPALERALKAALSQRPEVRLAFLFGSEARGMASSSSDIDLAALAPGADLLELSRELGLLLGREVEVLDLSAVTIPLLDEILRDGIVVGEAEPGLEARFRSHALASLEIDRPFYARMRDAWLKRLAARGAR